MDKAPIVPDNARQSPPADAPVGSKFQTVLRAIGLGILVLILWSIDNFAVRRFPEGSPWRYVVGAVVISVGLATVILITDRLNNKDS